VLQRDYPRFIWQRVPRDFLLAVYVPRMVGSTDPFDDEFTRLSRKERSYNRRFGPAVFLAAIAYVGFFPLFGALTSSTVTHAEQAGGILLIFLLIVGAALLSRSARAYALTKEERAFLKVYSAKKNLEAFDKDRREVEKLEDAQSELSQAVRFVVFPRKSSTLAVNALKGADALRDFLKKRLIPYLDNPTEPWRALDCLGILMQLLLNPTIDTLDSTLKSLDGALPASAVPAKLGVVHRARKVVLAVWGATISRRPFLTALFVAAGVFATLFLAAVYVFKGTPAEGFIAATGVTAVIFVWAHGEFRRQSESGGA
jgi:hypothetical protein